MYPDGSRIYPAAPRIYPDVALPYPEPFRPYLPPLREPPGASLHLLSRPTRPPHLKL